MTKEQYQKACEINERLQQLQAVKKEIGGAAPISNRRLTYTYKSNTSSDYYPCSKYIMGYIGNLLDTHDKLIRAEIENEIASLEQEIKSL